jgi:hypothetical protein
MSTDQVTSRLGPIGLLATTLAVGAACGGPSGIGSDEFCRNDEQCTKGNRCVSGACVPPARSGSTWAIEIVPGPATLGTADAELPPGVRAGMTQIKEWSFGEDEAQLTAVGTTIVPITLSYANTAVPPPTRSSMLWTVPPGIPGRPDLTFEASDVRAGRTGLLSVPSDLLERSEALQLGLLQLIPWPSEGGSPPFSFNVAPAKGRLDATVGSSVSLSGRVRDAANTTSKAGKFVAQAFQADTLVSNSSTVDAEGRFTLLIPATVATDPVTVALTPTNNDADPTFVSSDIALPVTSLDIKLPSYVSLPASYFELLLTNTLGEPVDPGMLVTARAVLDANDNGVTSFVKTAVSVDGKSAKFALLPGTEPLGLRYSFVVSPGITSGFATKCSGEVRVVAGNADPKQPTPLGGVALYPRSRVSGTVVNYTGSADMKVGRVANVVVAATLLEPDDPDCPPRTRTVTTTTDLDGKFALFLDPGHYRFDYDPPPHAPVPRKTEPDVEVAPTSREVRLDPAAYVSGRVFGPDSEPLPMATIRLYDVLCRTDDYDDCYGPNRTPPLLRAEAQTDATGHFIAIVSGP